MTLLENNIILSGWRYNEDHCYKQDLFDPYTIVLIYNDANWRSIYLRGKLVDFHPTLKLFFNGDYFSADHCEQNIENVKIRVDKFLNYIINMSSFI